MIKYASDKMIAFISWLNDYCPVSQDVYISILHGYDCIEVSVDEKVFALYQPDENKPMIMVSGDISPEGAKDGITEDELLGTIAHEYMHHIQACRGIIDFGEAEEAEAEKFAEKTIERFLDDYMR